MAKQDGTKRHVLICPRCGRTHIGGAPEVGAEEIYRRAWWAFSIQQRLGRLLPADCPSRAYWLAFAQQWTQVVGVLVKKPD